MKQETVPDFSLRRLFYLYYTENIKRLLEYIRLDAQLLALRGFHGVNLVRRAEEVRTAVFIQPGLVLLLVQCAPEAPSCSRAFCWPRHTRAPTSKRQQ